jgi:signal transduction histidine kinase
MLGKDREGFKNRMFTSFIAKESVPVFNNYIKKVFSSDVQERCELTLSVNVDSGSQISLKYKDDRVGFDLAELKTTRNNQKLANIENRIKTFNGSLLMESQPGHGVNYEIIIKC